MLLLKPLRVGSALLPNRIVFGAHLTNFGRGNRFTERHRAYYRARAAGGAGLLVTEALTVHPLDWPYEHVPFGHEDGIVASLGELAGAVRAANGETVLLAQLNHTGGQCSGKLLRQSPWAPSPMLDVASRRMARQMETDEIAQVVAGFAAAARRAVQGGLHGVEINAGQWSLLRQFLSPLTNQRQDGYGGPLENRLRMLLEAVRAVRAALDGGGGTAPVLGVKLCGDELAPWGGLTPTDAAEAARRLVAAGGVDYLSVEIGGPFSTHMTDAAMPVPQAHAAHLAQAVREAIGGRVPVFAEGRIEQPDAAETVLERGQADAVVMTRALISDPGLPRKLAAGDASGEPIRPHIGSARYFSVRGDWNRPLSDLANPRAGRERLLPEPAPAARPGRMLVVGGGPAGMEAAVTLARQGHAVTLRERSPALGGWAALLGGAVPARREYARLVDYQGRMLRRLSVTVQLGREVAPDDADLDAFSRVYVATGAAEPAVDLPGTGFPVLTPRALLAGGAALPAPDAGAVAVLDTEFGFRMGAAVEWLLERGYRVHVVTPDLLVGRELVESGDFLWFQRVSAKADGSGARFLPRTRALRREGTELVIADRFSGQETRLGPLACAVACAPETPDDALAVALRERHPCVVTVGDARAPRLMGEAVLHAHRTVVLGEGAPETAGE